MSGMKWPSTTTSGAFSAFSKSYMRSITSILVFLTVTLALWPLPLLLCFCSFMPVGKLVDRQRRERAEFLRPFGHGPLKVLCRYSAHFDGGSLVRQFIELNYIHLSCRGTDPVRHICMGPEFQ